MKKFVVVLLAFTLAFTAVFASGQKNQKETQKTLKLGHIRDMEHPTHKGAELFAKMVEEASCGKIKVEIYPNSQLGSIQEMFVQLKMGDLDLIYGGINTMAFINGGEALEITAIPFLFRDYEHMRTCLLSETFAPALKNAEKKTGVDILNITGDTAPRGLTSKRPIYSPSDCKGLKIRTAGSETVIRTFTSFGALPQQIPLADLYMSLKTGVVDAQENGAITVQNNSLFEVQNYYMKTDYCRDIETFYIAPSLNAKLNDADHKILMDASEKAGDLVTQLTNEQLDGIYEKLKTKMTVIQEPTLHLNEFRDRLIHLFDDWDGKKWPKGMLEAFRNM